MAAQKLPHLTTPTELTTAKSQHRCIVIDAYADWCGPCRTMAPYFQALADTFATHIAFFKIDIGADDTDDTARLADMLDISSLPTFIFIRDGAVVGSVVGADKARLEAGVRSLASA